MAVLARPSTILRRVATALLLSLGVQAPASADVVHIFGERAGDISNLRTTLVTAGHTVTTSTTLGTSLAGVDTVWGVHASTTLWAADRTLLASFLGAGGGIHLTAERPCCEALNDSVELFVNSVVIGGGVSVGGQGDVNGPYTFNPGALGGVTTGLESFPGSAAGRMSGVSGDNILATGPGGAIVGGVWDSSDLMSGRGRLTVLMDVNWFSSPARTAGVNNIQNFLASAPAAVPEPAPLALLGLGVLAMGLRRRSAAAAG